MKTTIVSICCLTYNHEPYIRKCLDGFIMQKTDFLFEVLIHDDASTDRTADIIREYEAKYPDIIKPIYQTENKYSKGIGITKTYQFPRAKGKYFAMCEGDDYWTDPLKLQKQVDFLEKNQEYSACFHDVEIVDKDNKPLENKDNYEIKYIDNQTDFDFDDFLFRGNHIHTPSVVFRAKNIENFILSNVVTGDYFLHLHNAYNGKIKRFEAKMAAYRVHLGGIFSLKRRNWSSKENFNFWTKQLNGYFHLLNNYKLNRKQKQFLNKTIYSLINILRIYAFENNDIPVAKQLALRQIKYTPKRGFNLKIFIGAIASLIVPRYMAKRINTNKVKYY
ncbi:MAG: glycosyltransferase [Bacteroidales bacterium]|nr:glycosyltransferase [Bacteroidales bacterium]